MSRNHALAVSLLAGWISAQTAAPAEAQVAGGRGYEVSVPAGFIVTTGEGVKPLIAAGGLALAATARFEGTGFLASIVVVPIAAPMEGDLAAPAFCDQLAQGSAARARATITSQKIVAATWGRACQSEQVETANPNRGAILTLVYRGKAAWGVTCNLDPKDHRTRAACALVLRSWKFTDEPGKSSK